MLLANYSLMHLLVQRLSAPLAVAKVVTELSLFLLSYHAQRRLVFAPQAPRPTLAPRVVDSAPSRSLERGEIDHSSGLRAQEPRATSATAAMMPS